MATTRNDALAERGFPPLGSADPVRERLREKLRAAPPALTKAAITEDLVRAHRVRLPLLGIRGPARSGKDTLATLLVNIRGYRRRGYADVLKLAAATALLAAFPDMKLTVDDVIALMEESKTHDANSQEGWARLFLQGLGMAGRELLHNRYWVEQVPHLAGIVITDVRLREEIDEIRATGGLVLLIERPGLARVNNHLSETALDGLPADAVIVNDREPAHMLAQVEALLAPHVQSIALQGARS